MGTVLIIAVVIVVVAVVALLVATPKIRERQGAAASYVVDELGGESSVEMIDRIANAFGSEPAQPGDLRGPGVLALGSDTLLFALTPSSTLRIARSDIRSAEATAEEGDAGKAMVKVTHIVDGEEITTSWRLRGAAEWAAALSAG